MIVRVPSTVMGLSNEFRDFVDGMLMKLAANSHKKTPTKESIPDIIKKLRAEILEFEEQFDTDKEDENTLVELFDVANFAFLAYVALRLQGVKHASNSKPE